MPPLTHNKRQPAMRSMATSQTRRSHSFAIVDAGRLSDPGYSALACRLRHNSNNENPGKQKGVNNRAFD